MLSTCALADRAGAASHPRSGASSGQPRTATPQLNPPVAWWRDHPDLAYNDEVIPELPRRVRGLPTSRWAPGTDLTLRSGWSQRCQSVLGRLTGRATSVPFTADLGGPERTTTDNTTTTWTCVVHCRCR